MCLSRCCLFILLTSLYTLKKRGQPLTWLITWGGCGFTVSQTNFFLESLISIIIREMLRQNIFLDFNHAPQMINGRPLIIYPYPVTSFYCLTQSLQLLNSLSSWIRFIFHLKFDFCSKKIHLQPPSTVWKVISQSGMKHCLSEIQICRIIQEKQGFHFFTRNCDC